MARRFVLIRDEHDAVNPPGVVAEGIVFTSSRVAINWTTKPYSTQVFDTLSDLMAIQKRNGVTRIQWLDSENQGTPAPREAGLPKLMAARDQLHVLLGKTASPHQDHEVSDDQGGVLVVLSGQRAHRR